MLSASNITTCSFISRVKLDVAPNIHELATSEKFSSPMVPSNIFSKPPSIRDTAILSSITEMEISEVEFAVVMFE